MINRMQRLMRIVIESATRKWLFRRKLPREFGSVRIFVSPSAGLKYLFRSMDAVDKPLLSIVNEYVKAGDIVWDVGANIGLFSFAAAGKCGPTGRVVALEPDAWLVQVLRRSASGIPSSCAEVVVVAVAVAQDLRIDEFRISARSRAISALHGFGYDDRDQQFERQTVMVVSIDWLSKYFPLPDVLKIDVEGAEMEVLKGATDLFEKRPPIVICEVSQKNQKYVTSFLHERGYLLYDCEERAAKRTPRDAAPWNTLAIPKKSQTTNS